MTLALRKFANRDIKPLFAWFTSERDALQWAGAGLSWPLQAGELRKLIRDHRSIDAPREVWAVDQKARMAAHFQLSFNQRLATVGLGRIAINPALRGQGLAQPLLKLILDRAFSRPWVHRVELLVYTHNTPAIRAYQHAGFVHEGTRRQTTPIADELWDTHIMSLLRFEFDKRTERE